MNRQYHGIEMVVATLWQPRWSECISSWRKNAKYDLPVRIISGQTIVHAYEQGRIESDRTIIGFCHDDLLIHEAGWDERVLAEFNDPKVAMVGFAGARGHGHHNLYKVPYHLPNLARQQFLSNLTDAEVHGQRFTGTCDVSVLDGLAMFIRSSALDEIGGWPQDGSYGYFLYAENMALRLRRAGYKIRLVGVDCTHLGGKSSGLKQDQVFDYDGEHRRLYDEFHDCLPAMVED